jgi:hypothetical protein
MQPDLQLDNAPPKSDAVPASKPQSVGEKASLDSKSHGGLSREPSRELFNRKQKNNKEALELKQIQQTIQRHAEVAKQKLLAKADFKDFFVRVCGDQSKKAARLTKPKFRQFLVHRFGINIGEKVGIILDFNQAVTSVTYVEQIAQILKERSLIN